MSLRLSRRSVLAAGAGSAFLASAAGGLAWFAWGYRLRPGEAAIAVSEKELCVLRALVEAMLPEADGLPSGVALGVHQRIDEEVFAQSDAFREDFRAALQLIEHAPPLFGVFGRMTRLSPEARAAVFSRMLLSDQDLLAQAATAVRQMANMFYYAHEATWRALGYEGPWLEEPVPPDSATLYAKRLAVALGSAGRPGGAP